MERAGRPRILPLVMVDLMVDGCAFGQGEAGGREAALLVRGGNGPPLRHLELVTVGEQ